MRSLSLKFRVLFPLLMAIALIVSIFTAVSLFIFEKYQRNQAHAHSREIQNVLQNRYALEATHLKLILETIIQDKSIRQALIEQDRQTLLKLTRKPFQQLLEVNDITHYYFQTPDRVNLLCVHDPDRYGDTINRWTTLQAQQLGRTAWGLELGKFGTFTLHVVQPCYHNGKLIGYVELGKEIEQLQNNIAKLHDVKLLTFIDKKWLDRDTWEQGRTLFNKHHNWNAWPDHVVSHCDAATNHDIFQIKRKNFYTTSDGHIQYYVTQHPLTDASSASIGYFQIAHNISSNVAGIRTALLVAIILTMIVSVVVCAILYYHIKHMEQQLQQQNLQRIQLSDIIEHSPSIAIRWKASRGWPIEFISENIAQLGYDVKQFHEQHLSLRNIICKEDFRKVVKQSVQFTRETDKNQFDLQFRIITADGDIRWAECCIWITRDERQRVTHFQGVMYDITDRVDAQQKFQKSHTLQLAAQRVSRMGYWDWNIVDDTLYWSDELYDIYKRPKQLGPLTSDQWNQAIIPEDYPRVSQEIHQALVGNQSLNSDYGINCHDGEIRYVHADAEVVRDDNGNPVRFFGTILDITERVQQQQQLQRAIEQANAASQARSQFLANMSHEIRTPMTAILGYTDLIQDPETSTKQRDEFIHTIKQNGQHLLDVINDILDLSKIEAGGDILEKRPTEVCPLIQDVISTMRVPAREKNLSLHVEYMPPLPQTILTDPLRLRQILINLIANAIKFTEQGGVRLVIRANTDMLGNNQFSVEIIDTGIGMTEQQTQKLFQPFVQADSSMSRKFGGTGLGLAISKRLANALDGDITVDSTPDKGSSFLLTIDRGPIDDVPMLEHFSESVSSSSASKTNENCTNRFKGRLLLVEDGIDNQRLISHLLKNLGFDVVVAENGRVACNIVEHDNNGNQPFDLILMDMQMPEMDGYQATQYLRNHGCETPIIALTAHAMPGDREKCIDVGCNDYATKPINKTNLARIIAQYIQPDLQSEAGDQIDNLTHCLNLLLENINRMTHDINDCDTQSIKNLAAIIRPNCKNTSSQQLIDQLLQLDPQQWNTIDLEQLKYNVDQLVKQADLQPDTQKKGLSA